jgi:hypothetical protein
MENANKTVAVVTVKDTVNAEKMSIDNAHEAFIPKVKSIAADYAVHGIPELKAASFEQYIETIRPKYSGILNDSSLNLSASVRNQLGALDIFSLRQKIKDLKLKINAGRSLLDTLKEARKKLIGQLTWKEFGKLKLWLNIFTVIECLGYILAFLSIGDNIALAAIWGILLGVGQTTGIKALVLWMRDGSGAALSKAYKLLIWTGVALVATGLGLLRYATIQAAGDDGFAHSILAPFVFILISYFLISVLALYVWHNYPTTQEQSNLKKAAGLDDEITAKEAELKEWQQQANQLTEDCNTVAQVHTLLIHAAKDFYHRVNNHFLYSVGIFKSTNRISRTDNISPECFSLPVLPLEVPNYEAWDELELDTKPITDNV